MANNIDTPDKVEQSTTPPDFSGLENALNHLQESIEKQLEIQEEEKKQAEQEQEEIQKKEIENAEIEEENNKLIKDYQEQLLSNQANQEDVLIDILAEMQKFNEQALQMEEIQAKTHDQMTKLQAEGFLGIIITVVVVAAVKVFITEVTKW